LTITGSSVDYGWGGEIQNVPDYSRGPDGRVSSGDGGPTGSASAAGGGHGGSGVVLSNIVLVAIKEEQQKQLAVISVM